MSDELYVLKEGRRLIICVSLFLLFGNKYCKFVIKALNLIYETLKNQQAKLIKNGLAIKEFTRLSNYAIESKK
jgi:hypothetical protein